jgi:histone H3/H4
MAEEFTLASMRRLLGKQGEIRVSVEAAEALRYILGDYGMRIAKAAYKTTVRDGRKTILERDIYVAIKNLEEQSVDEDSKEK